MNHHDDDRCGSGSHWGCGKPIADGQQGHLVKGAARCGTEDVLFHPECCPCAIDPGMVRKVGAA